MHAGNPTGGAGRAPPAQRGRTGVCHASDGETRASARLAGSEHRAVRDGTGTCDGARPDGHGDEQFPDLARRDTWASSPARRGAPHGSARRPCRRARGTAGPGGTAGRRDGRRPGRGRPAREEGGLGPAAGRSRVPLPGRPRTGRGHAPAGGPPFPARAGVGRGPGGCGHGLRAGRRGRGPCRRTRRRLRRAVGCRTGRTARRLDRRAQGRGGAAGGAPCGTEPPTTARRRTVTSRRTGAGALPGDPRATGRPRCPRPRPGRRRAADRIRDTASVRRGGGGHRSRRPACPARRHGLRGLSGPGPHRPRPELAAPGRTVALRAASSGAGVRSDTLGYGRRAGRGTRTRFSGRGVAVQRGCSLGDVGARFRLACTPRVAASRMLVRDCGES